MDSAILTKVFELVDKQTKLEKKIDEVDRRLDNLIYQLQQPTPQEK